MIWNAPRITGTRRWLAVLGAALLFTSLVVLGLYALVFFPTFTDEVTRARRPDARESAMAYRMQGGWGTDEDFRYEVRVARADDGQGERVVWNSVDVAPVQLIWRGHDTLLVAADSAGRANAKTIRKHDSRTLVLVTVWSARTDSTLVP